MSPATAQSLLMQAVGGNQQVANRMVAAAGGDPVAALTGLTSAHPEALFANAFGTQGALSVMTGLLGGQQAFSSLSGALGTNGSLGALFAGNQNASLQALAQNLLATPQALGSLQSLLGNNAAGMQALNALMGGNMGSLPNLVNALGGPQGAFSALTGALGGEQALNALVQSLGVENALAALTNAIGLEGALAALGGGIGDQVSNLVGGNMAGLCGFAPLTGSFALSACEETKSTRSIDYAQQEEGGIETAKKIDETLGEKHQQAMKDRTAQLHASTLDQTRQIGSIEDANAAAQAARDIGRDELATVQGLLPHEQTCALPSQGPALATTDNAAAAIARAMTNDAMAAANPIPGTPAAAGPGAVAAARYDEYCLHFADPTSNNGNDGCNIPPAPETEAEAAAGEGAAPPPAGGEEAAADATPADTVVSGLLPNADIDVENILLRDTIDMEEERFRVASQALLRNLVVPKTYPPIPPGELEDAAVKEYIVRKERVDTLRRIAADTVSSMIARRTAIEIPDPVAAGWVIQPETWGDGEAFYGGCSIPNTPGDPNAFALNYVQQRIGSRNYLELRPNGSVRMTFCQRLSREASRTYRGVHAGSASEAWASYRRMGVATLCSGSSQCLPLLRPGDMVYMTSTTGNGRRYGHTGIYSGSGNFISALGLRAGGVAERPLFGASGWEGTLNGGRVLGFVRPSGVAANPADCGTDTSTTPTTQGGTAPPESAGAPATGGETAETGNMGTPGGVRPMGSYDDMLQRLGQRESGGVYSRVGGDNNNFLGKYQMGDLALIETGCIRDLTGAGDGRSGYRGPSKYRSYRWTGGGSCSGVGNYSQFLNGAAIQDRAIRRNNERNIAQLRSWNAERYQCTTVGRQLVTPSGMLCASHLVGAWGTNQWLRSNGTAAAQDAFGTKAEEYMEMCKNYDSPWGGACDGSRPAMGEAQTFTHHPPDPRPVKELIREIRQRAGVPNDEIGEDPSYNEIMLAMTKERFFDPRYFADLAGNIGSMEQNELSLNAYISMTLQDIHLLQEQINALVAARASLQIERGSGDTQE